jgi:2-polyprenyl-6-methoxyphenol hydroxylase-like FAD-dependent oxidoreductase
MAAMTLRILVVGAGIAGLATARALRVAGFQPDVVGELPATKVEFGDGSVAAMGAPL